VELRVTAGSLGDLEVAEAWALHDPDTSATNTEHDPDRVVPRPHPVELRDGSAHLVLPPVSWHAVRLTRR
jgi:alpha-L-arabinofuranosidase